MQELRKARKTQVMAFGLPQISNQIILMVSTSFLMYFFTDYFGLTIGAVTLMFLIARIFDSVNDPLEGIIIDRLPDFKGGKFRIITLVGFITAGILQLLLFLGPQFSPLGKLVYSYIVYISSGIVISFMTIAVMGMASRVTEDPFQRTTMGTFRSVGGAIGGTIAMMGTIPIVKAFGNGEETPGGYTRVMALYAVIIIICSILFFFIVKENIKINTHENKEEKVNFKDTLPLVIQNTPFLMITASSFFALLAVSVQASVQVYFAKYILGNSSLVGLLAGISTSAMLIFAFVVTPLSKKIGKRNVNLVSIFAALISAGIIFFAGTNLIILSVASFLTGIAMAFGNITGFSMLVDTIEYGEWKSGKRAEGLIYAINGFLIKLGVALAGVISGGLLAFYQYDATEITEQAITGIKMSYIFIPIIFLIIRLVFLLFYDLTESRYSEIMAEVKNRREIAKGSE